MPVNRKSSIVHHRSLAVLLVLLLSSCTLPVESSPTALIPTADVPHKASFLIAKPTSDLPAGDGLPAVAESTEAADLATATLPYLVWTATPEPTATATFTPEPTATSAPNATPAATDPGPQTSDRTHYTLTLTLDYVHKAVAVNETIRYTNTTGDTLSSIVLAVRPNLWSDCFNLTTFMEDDAEVANYTLAGQRLTFVPAQPLAPGAVTNLALGYSLNLPVKSSDGTFGYMSTQINLTDWYPFVVPYGSGNWILHDTYPFGEDLVYDASDFDVNLKVSDPSVVVAASAPAEENGETVHYHLEAARTFVLSASNAYQVDESAVGPVKIRSYYFPGDGNASQAVVWMATQSLALYGVKFAPYPYETLSIVESNLNDGQEFDGLVFLSSNFYTGYNGSARSNLVTIGTHEIAHQWWFGLVGNDQAMEPWLDEALSLYSERIFYEYNYPGYGNWWWNYRVNYFGPTGYVDQSIYAFGTFRAYVNAVYLNGANVLEDLRSRIHDDDFMAFLKDYAARYSHRRATAYDFFATLREHTDADFSDIMRAYFQGSY